MEESQQQEKQIIDEDGGNSGRSSGKSSFLCRQSSCRWIPTTEQIRILRELYYNNGIRSPSAEQIQRISARLRQYGKIEGKNVFYWFQNHKARERQKKRFAVDIPMQQGKPDDHSIYNKYTNLTTGLPPSNSPSSSSQAVLGYGQIGSTGYHVPTFMEKSLRDCSISGASTGGGAYMKSRFGWPVLESPPTCYSRYETPPEMETLQLFPLHGDEENINGKYDGSISNSFIMGGSEDYFQGWLLNAEDGSGGVCSASLELSLSSSTSYSGGANHST